MSSAVVAERGFSPAPPQGGAAGWLSELHRRAYASFESLGFPTPHDEAWRFTGLQPITETAWVAGTAAYELGALPASGVRVYPLLQGLADAEPALGRLAAFDRNVFTALNTAAFEDAIVVEIRAGAVVAEPISIQFRAPASATPRVYSPRLLVLAGERTQASLVQTFASDGRSFTNAVTEIALADSALLEHTLLQRESEAACHMHAVAASQARASRYASHHVALGGALARTDIRVALEGEGAECGLYGLFVGRGTQHLDQRTTIDHARPRCVSRQLYKGILDDAARGVFHGTVVVRQDAQKTDAVQTNKNLLLSNRALVNSTPALEILADDVKCKHGSTTGQLDAAALFYLRSRGIGEEAARALLTWAFAADVAERIPAAAVRSEVERELGVRLSGAAGAAA
jgi:Fe-S cluster assembly protein SufD